MKRYNNYLYEDKEGGWVMFEDVKTTAIMNFNLLEQIRELEQKVSRRDKLIKDMEERAYDEYCDKQD